MPEMTTMKQHRLHKHDYNSKTVKRRIAIEKEFCKRGELLGGKMKLRVKE